jgi:hypothetical protein
MKKKSCVNKLIYCFDFFFQIQASLNSPTCTPITLVHMTVAWELARYRVTSWVGHFSTTLLGSSIRMQIQCIVTYWISSRSCSERFQTARYNVSQGFITGRDNDCALPGSKYVVGENEAMERLEKRVVAPVHQS